MFDGWRCLYLFNFKTILRPNLQRRVYCKIHPAECSQTIFQKDIFDSPFEACGSLKKRKKESSSLHREIFYWTSKVIWNCPSFASLRYVIGPESSGHFLNQSDSKLKPIAVSSQSRFPALLAELPLAPGDIFLVVIGCFDCLGFSFATSNWKVF